MAGVCCGVNRKPYKGYPLSGAAVAREQLLMQCVRPGERVLASAEAVGLLDVAPPEPPVYLPPAGYTVPRQSSFLGPQTSSGTMQLWANEESLDGQLCCYHLTMVALVVPSMPRLSANAHEAAILGVRQGWLNHEVSVVLPLCGPAGKIRIMNAEHVDTVVDLAARESGEGHRFYLVLPFAEEGSEGATEQHALIAALATLQATQASGFPCSRGTLDWVWSYAPTQSIPMGLQAPMPTTKAVHRQTHTDRESVLPMLVVTFNCGGREPPEATELAPLLAAAAPSGGHQPALILLTLQEICPLYLAYYPSALAQDADVEAAKSWVAALSEALSLVAGGINGACPYRHLVTKSLIGMLLVAFAHEAAMPKVVGTSDSEARCGAYGAGNKGAVATSLSVGGHRICVINVHLAAGVGPAKAEARYRNLEDIFHRLRFHDCNGMERNALEHDLLVLAGDFNSRLSALSDAEGATVAAATAPHAAALTSEASQELIEQCLVAHGDEATALRQAQRGLWAMLEEAPVSFPPTYKFTQGEDGLDLSKCPAWCDRIFWWARPDRLTAVPRAESYRRIDEVLCSDHRAVVLILDVVCSSSTDHH